MALPEGDDVSGRSEAECVQSAEPGAAECVQRAGTGQEEGIRAAGSAAAGYGQFPGTGNASHRENATVRYEVRSSKGAPDAGPALWEVLVDDREADCCRRAEFTGEGIRVSPRSGMLLGRRKGM